MDKHKKPEKMGSATWWGGWEPLEGFEEAEGGKWIEGVESEEGGKWTSPIPPPATPPGCQGGREVEVGVGGTSPEPEPEPGPEPRCKLEPADDVAKFEREAEQRVDEMIRGHAAGWAYRFRDDELGRWEVTDTVDEGVPVWLSAAARGHVADINRAAYLDPPSDREIRGACYWAGMGA